MSITLITDSSSDITLELEKELDIRILNMPINFGKEEFIDRVTLSTTDFYNKLANCTELPKTSMINSYTFKDAFEEELKKGNEVICLPIASALSVTYSQAVQAAQEIGSDKIAVLDPNATTFSLKAIVTETVKYIKSGLTFSEVVEKTKQLIKNVRLIAVIDVLKYLKAGGRLSSTSAFIGTLLNIKPIIVLDGGAVKPIAKCVGNAKGYQYIINHLLKEKIDTGHDFYFGHSNNEELAHDFKKLVDKKVTQNNFHISNIGATVGTHTGPNCVGIAYFVKD